MPIEQYLEVALLLLVSISALNDLATRRIPNRLLLAGLGCALLLRAISTEPGTALLAAFGGMGVGFALFLPFYLVGGMAGGDVKMMTVVGAFTGVPDAIVIAISAWCIGGVMAILLMLVRGRLRLAVGNMWQIIRGATMRHAGMGAPLAPTSAGSMPYGLAIAAGTVAVLVRHYG